MSSNSDDVLIVHYSIIVIIAMIMMIVLIGIFHNRQSSCIRYRILPNTSKMKLLLFPYESAQSGDLEGEVTWSTSLLWLGQWYSACVYL